MERNTPPSGSMGDPDECRALNKLSAYVWSEEVFDSIHRAFESQSSNQEDGEDEVRQSGRDVNSLEKTTVGFSISEKLLVRKPCSGSHLNEWKFPTHASFMVWKIKHIHLPTDRKTNVDLEPRHTLFIAPDVLGVTVAADGTDLQSYRAYLWIKKGNNLWLTLPVVSMPRMQQTQRTVHAAIRHRTIHHCNPPESSMLVEMFRVSLYQK